MAEIVVLGGGLAGLGCAQASGAKVFEAKSHAGGHVYSQNIEGVYFDEGAHISHSKDTEFVDLICKNAEEVNHIKQCNVSNYADTQWIGYPVQNHLVNLPISKRFKALSGLLLAQFNPQLKSPENYRQWCQRQYGNYLTENFYKRYTEKYWRVEMEALATDWLSGRLLPSQVRQIVLNTFKKSEEKQAVFSTFRYPKKQGFYGFFRSMADSVDITYQAKANKIDLTTKTVFFENGHSVKFDYLASSIPLTTLIQLIEDVPDAVKEAAAKLRSTQLICVNIVLKRPDLVKKHWFYIYDQSIEASRVSIPTNFYGDPEKTGVQAEVFRRDDELVDLEKISQETTEDMIQILKFNPSDILTVKPIHVPFAYIISTQETQKARSFILEWLQANKIYGMGLFGKWAYIWSDQAFRDGEATARAINQEVNRK